MFWEMYEDAGPSRVHEKENMTNSSNFEDENFDKDDPNLPKYLEQINLRASWILSATLQSVDLSEWTISGKLFNLHLV